VHAYCLLVVRAARGLLGVRRGVTSGDVAQEDHHRMARIWILIAVSTLPGRQENSESNGESTLP
jgi:hypothetical protein